MTEQPPALDEGAAPVASAPELPAPPSVADEVLPVAAHVLAVRNTVIWATREDGAHLWRARWLSATCGPRLLRLLDPAEPALSEHLETACRLLEPVDGLPWFERLAPLLQVLDALNAALDRVDPAPPVLRARALLVSGAALDERAAEPTARPEGGRRERGDGRKGTRSKPAALGPQPRRRPSPPSLGPLALGDPADTGRALADHPQASPALVEALAACGISRVDQLLRTPPATVAALALQDPAAVLPASGTAIAVRVTVRARWLTLRPGGRVAHLHVTWGEHTLRCSWPDAWPAGAAWTLPDDELVLAGTLQATDTGLVLTDPLPWRASRQDEVWRPAYGLAGVDDSALQAFLHELLATSVQRLIDPLPRDLLGSARVPGLPDALRDLHCPLGARGRGRTRLVFDEFFSYRLSQSAEQVVRPKGLVHPLGHDLLSQLCLQHGIELDDEQERAFDDVRRDLAKPVAMLRLLQGDVGSGKALVALLAAVQVAESRSQVLFLAPDGLAAEHRYMFAEPLLRSVGLVPHLLGREPSKAQLDALRRGEAHIIFASHSLVTRPEGLPEFKQLGLVVAEERQSFGTVTHADLGQDKHHPDLLVVTSVPIPSSLVFTMFATYDLTVLPPNPASKVQTEVVQPDQRQRAFEVIRETLAAGQQAYIVFPLSRGADVVDRARGTSLAAALAKEAFNGAKVALYHGTMSREERLRIFEDFRHRRVDVLLATTSIEDAPEVGNATAMVVENADRFDLVRLHRLRGHVSQGLGEGRCVLVVSQEPAAAGQAIVDLVASEEDGFAIAELDRKERGDAELVGGRLAELPQFELGDPVRDRELFIRARQAAIQLLVKDPQLRQRAHRSLARQVPGLSVAPAADRDPGQEPRDGGGKKRRRRRRRSGSKR